MSRFAAKLLMVLSTIALIVVAFVCTFNQAKVALIIAGIVWAVIYFILSWFARCPNCGKLPGRNFLLENYCPRCGEPLD